LAEHKKYFSRKLDLFLKISEETMSHDATNPVIFFESVYQAFLIASESSSSPVEFSIDIAGFPIQLRFANSALIPSILPALRHQIQLNNTSNHALKICIWDTVSTNTPIPKRPWSRSDFLRRGEINGYGDERIHIAYHIGTDFLCMLDKKRNLAIFWTRDANKLFSSPEASPLRPIFHWWMRLQGIQLVHASSVGTAQGSVLIVGRGGSGKSTTALACLSKGMLYLGDDMVLITSKPSPYVFNLYNSAKADINTLDKLRQSPLRFSTSHSTNNGKTLLFLNDGHTNQITNCLPLLAIIIPKIRECQHTEIVKASPIEGLKAIAPSTVLMLSQAGSDDLSVISDVIQQVPVFNMYLGNRLEEVPEAILSLLPS
jgi:hypothetical protein